MIICIIDNVVIFIIMFIIICITSFTLNIIIITTTIVTVAVIIRVIRIIIVIIKVIIIIFFSNIRLYFFTIAFLGLRTLIEREKGGRERRERMYGDMCLVWPVWFCLLLLIMQHVHTSSFKVITQDSFQSSTALSCSFPISVSRQTTDCVTMLYSTSAVYHRPVDQCIRESEIVSVSMCVCVWVICIQTTCTCRITLFPQCPAYRISEIILCTKFIRER